MLIDSHAHLDSQRYADDRAAMLARACEAGVGAVLAIGIGEQAGGDAPSARPSAASSTASPNIPRLFASAGVYPHNTAEIDDAVLAKLDGLLAEPEVIACGEIGLDYYHEGAPHRSQREGLIRQLEIAAARKRPILIHCRPEGRRRPTPGTISSTSWKTTGGRTGLGGIMHCFGGGWEQARRSLDLGFLISFAGNLTYPKASRCAMWPPSSRSTRSWLKPTPPGWPRRPIAASATSRPWSPAPPSRWPNSRRREPKKSPRQPRKTSSGCFAWADVGN